MINKQDFMSKYPDLTEGMNAYSDDGEKLGKVVSLEDDCITIEKGLFFPKDFTIRYDDVLDIRGGDLFLRQGRGDLDEWSNEKYEGWDEYEKASSYGESQDEVRVPVTEEKLEAQKTARETGEVRIRKVVHSELKNLQVPVSKEEVIVERTPVTDSREASPGEDAFKEGEIRVPIVEEEAHVVKRPVVKEEVRVRKDTHTEQEEYSGEVRKTDVEIDKEGGIGSKKKPSEAA